METSRFEQDLRDESLIARYLDEHLYNAGLFERHDRVYNRDEQISGCDIVLTSNYWGIKDCKVDEKSQTTYFNRDMATFAFELYYLKDDRPQIGWLLNKQKCTEAYLLVWPFSNSEEKTGAIANLKYEDIAGIRYLLVKKDKIIKYLNNAMYSEGRLLSEAKKIHNNPELFGRVPIKKRNDIYFYKTTTLREKPINIVIKREILWLLADMRGSVIGNTSFGQLKEYW